MGNRDCDSAMVVGAVEGNWSGKLIKSALFSGEGVVIGAEDGLGGDGTEKIVGGGFGTAMMGCDQEVGGQKLRMEQQLSLGDGLDVAGEEDRFTGVTQPQDHG